MHWATRWHHSALFVTSSSVSSRVVPISFRSHLTMSIQLFLVVHQLPLVPPQFPLYSPTRNSGVLHTFSSHLSLNSAMMSSNFHKPLFFLMSSFLILISNSLHWNLWWTASIFPSVQLEMAITRRHTVSYQLSVITKGQVCTKQPRRLRPQCGPISHPPKKNQN